MSPSTRAPYAHSAETAAMKSEGGTLLTHFSEKLPPERRCTAKKMLPPLTARMSWRLPRQSALHLHLVLRPPLPLAGLAAPLLRRPRERARDVPELVAQAAVRAPGGSLPRALLHLEANAGQGGGHVRVAILGVQRRVALLLEARHVGREHADVHRVHPGARKLRGPLRVRELLQAVLGGPPGRARGIPLPRVDQEHGPHRRARREGAAAEGQDALPVAGGALREDQHRAPARSPRGAVLPDGLERGLARVAAGPVHEDAVHVLHQPADDRDLPGAGHGHHAWEAQARGEDKAVQVGRVVGDKQGRLAHVLRACGLGAVPAGRPRAGLTEGLVHNARHDAVGPHPALHPAAERGRVHGLASGEPLPDLAHRIAASDQRTADDVGGHAGDRGQDHGESLQRRFLPRAVRDVPGPVVVLVLPGLDGRPWRGGHGRLYALPLRGARRVKPVGIRQGCLQRRAP
mmetsp:Transcript_40021/g.104296  ORF Transcript_40021/g.104296 Transcript_40021/m.104296 type:complete len:460 (+) Transcript_40021:36-1415(+)